MKFITSRIISPGKVKSLMEIISEKEKEVEQPQKTVEASAKKKQVKTASAEPTKIVKASKQEMPKQEAPKQEAPKQEAKVEKNYAIKTVKASQNKSANKMGVVWNSIKAEASLTPEDRNFLSEYFKRYYPADYVEALIAQY